MRLAQNCLSFVAAGRKAATVIVVTVFYCLSGSAQSGPLFTLLSPKSTGINFTNTVKEDDSLNIFTYEYLYNGHGVGVADFNKDGLIDIFFSGNAVPNKLYLNKGNLVFEDITKQAGVRGNGSWSTGVSIADVNGDGLPDIYVGHSGKNTAERLVNELYINKGSKAGTPRFEESARTYGLDAPGTQSTQAAFFDYDLDGDLDMLLVNHSNHTYNAFLNTKAVRARPDMNFGNRLFRNDRKADGSRYFTDVTLEAGIINNALNFGLGVAVSDINGDGWPDLYTTSDYSEQDCYYVNNKKGGFVQSLQASFTHISKYSMGVDVADYNNDARPDVITLDMLPQDNRRQKLLKGPDEYDQYHLLLDSGYYHQQMRNMLQLNRGADAGGQVRFSEIGQLAGMSNTDWSWSPLLVDLDNDGWKDLVVTNGYLRDFTDLDFLKYTMSEAQLTAAASGNLAFKNYELIRKMPSNKLNNYLFRNEGNLKFNDKSKDWGFTQPSVSNCAAYADLDNDGDNDLIIGNNNQPVMIYRNNAEKTGQHYLKISLQGNGDNSSALGAKIKVYAGSNMQYAEHYTVRGFQSTVTDVVLFGLGNQLVVDSVIINWPGEGQTVLRSIKADQLITVKESEKQKTPATPALVKLLFQPLANAAGIDFIHKENDFIDFKNDVLVPYQLSRSGPALAKGDVNGDGLEDIFIGGAIGQSGSLYLQIKEGMFQPSLSQPWQADKASEDVSALFFDADGDGDLDLYVVSGGNEYEGGVPEYADRLYRNNGKGLFEKALNALPVMLGSKQTVAAADFDNDGDLDLFIGGGYVPGAFPLAERSYLLRNESKGETILFTDITQAVNKDLVKPGSVTCAQWADLNKDGYPELLVAGDWMPVQLYDNKKGTLENASMAAGLQFTEGMWAAIKAADIDGDGDTDFVLGNCGDNLQFHAGMKEPMTIYAADFDDNGQMDPVLCYYIDGKSYPMASRDELLDQIVPLRKKFVKYHDYADATISDIFSKEKLTAATVYHCYQDASVILVNNGSNHFSIQPLPIMAQFSKIYGIDFADYDGDGKADLLLTGNFFPYRTQLGRNDAGMGLLLKNKGGGAFEPLDNAATGLYIAGDVRGMTTITSAKGEKLLIVVKNDDAVQVIKKVN